MFQPARKMAKSRALEKPIIQINGPRRISYLCFDVDRQFAGIAWDDANLPQPTFVVVNPKNLHAHLIWEIDPVWLRRKSDPRHGDGESTPVRYMKAVYKAMRRALKADAGYSGFLVKNPLHTSWRAICGPSKPYRLSELANHLELTDSDAELRDNPTGRNCTLFDSIRLWGYRNRNDYAEWYRFRTDLDDELDRLNQQLSEPLPLREVSSIGKSVATWVWNKYTGTGRNARQRGIMGLDPSEPIRLRQQKGQSYTCRVRMDSTTTKIKNSVGMLIRDSKPITKVAVALLSGLHRNTVARYWSVAIETVSLRDASTSSLRSGAATPCHRDSLNPPNVAPDRPSYPDLLAEHQGSTIRAFARAQQYARQGILIDNIPKTFKTSLQTLVDKIEAEGRLECIDQPTPE